MNRFVHILARRRFRVPQFEVSSFEFEKLGEAMLEPVDACPSKFAASLPANPTAGELRQSIERHLQAREGKAVAAEELSPADELGYALRELRQSLG